MHFFGLKNLTQNGPFHTAPWKFKFISRGSCVSSIPSRLASFCLLTFSVSIILRWSISSPDVAFTWFTWFTASNWSSCHDIAAHDLHCLLSHFGLALPIVSIVLCPYWFLQRLSLRHCTVTGKPGYFSFHLSFIRFINPLPLLLFSLSIFNRSSFISFVHLLLVLAGFALFVLRFWSIISCWISLVVLGSFISNLNPTASSLRYCVDMLLRLGYFASYFSLIRFMNPLPLSLSHLSVFASHFFSSLCRLIGTILFELIHLIQQCFSLSHLSSQFPLIHLSLLTPLEIDIYLNLPYNVLIKVHKSQVAHPGSLVLWIRQLFW